MGPQWRRKLTSGFERLPYEIRETLKAAAQRAKEELEAPKSGRVVISSNSAPAAKREPK